MTVQDILTDLRIDYREEGHHHCRPGWIQINCPWCDRGSNKYHLGCNLALKYWNCWRCGGKSMLTVLLKLGLGFSAAQEFVRSVDTSHVKKRERARLSLKNPAGISELQPAHRDYLLSRNFDPDEISRIWKVQGISIHPRLGWRLFIPIEKSQIQVSWTTRAIVDDAPLRYISASPEEESENHKHLLYGSDYCHSTVIICEGPTDVWRIGPGAVATFGTAYSDTQVKEMLRYPYRYVCFDNENTAQRKADELCAMLSVFPGQTTNVQLDAKDPGSARPDEIFKLRRMARLE